MNQHKVGLETVFDLKSNPEIWYSHCQSVLEIVDDYGRQDETDESARATRASVYAEMSAAMNKLKSDNPKKVVHQIQVSAYSVKMIQDLVEAVYGPEGESTCTAPSGLVCILVSLIQLIALSKYLNDIPGVLSQLVDRYNEYSQKASDRPLQSIDQEDPTRRTAAAIFRSFSNATGGHRLYSEYNDPPFNSGLSKEQDHNLRLAAWWAIQNWKVPDTTAGSVDLWSNLISAIAKTRENLEAQLASGEDMGEDSDPDPQ